MIIVLNYILGMFLIIILLWSLPVVLSLLSFLTYSSGQDGRPPWAQGKGTETHPMMGEWQSSKKVCVMGDRGLPQSSGRGNVGYHLLGPPHCSCPDFRNAILTAAKRIVQKWKTVSGPHSCVI